MLEAGSDVTTATDDKAVTKERADIVASEPCGVSESGAHMQVKKTPVNQWSIATFKSISMEDGDTVNTDITSALKINHLLYYSNVCMF